MQQRSEAFTAINPMQRVPALLLDDGTVIAESIAICRYFEALHPDPPLFGRGALESALVEMWNRRAELHLLFPVAAVFQHQHPAMKQMVQPQVPDWGEANKPRVSAFLQFLDGELKERPFVAGANYTVADITALVAVDFMRVSKLVRAGGTRQCAALAPNGFGPSERCRLDRAAARDWPGLFPHRHMNRAVTIRGVCDVGLGAEKEHADDADGGIDRSAGPKAIRSKIVHDLVLFIHLRALSSGARRSS